MKPYLCITVSGDLTNQLNVCVSAPCATVLATANVFAVYVTLQMVKTRCSSSTPLFPRGCFFIPVRFSYTFLLNSPCCVLPLRGRWRKTAETVGWVEKEKRDGLLGEGEIKGTKRGQLCVKAQFPRRFKISGLLTVSLGHVYIQCIK